MTTQEIAQDLVALCRAGKYAEAGEKHWADDVLSIEAAGENPEQRGKSAARGKHDHWESANDVHDAQVGDPWVNGDQFVVRFTIDQTQKATGQRMILDEVGLYTVRNGKIVEERFFY